MTFHTIKLLLLFFSANTLLQAQSQRVLHQTFEVNGIEEIHLDLYGEVELIPWAGAQIMSETQVRLEGAPPHVLKFFIEEKERYKIEGVLGPDYFVLQSVDKTRPQIIYKSNECYEEVKIRLFIPEEFEISEDGKVLRRKL